MKDTLWIASKFSVELNYLHELFTLVIYVHQAAKIVHLIISASLVWILLREKFVKTKHEEGTDIGAKANQYMRLFYGS